jgi:hypothetical protein
VYTFVWTGAEWAMDSRAYASDAAAGDAYGVSLAIYGSYSVVGAHGVSLGNAKGNIYYIMCI